MDTAKLKRISKATLMTVGLLFGLTIASSLSAQAQYRSRGDYGYSQGIYRIAGDQGYRDGAEEGAKDARDNDRFNPNDKSKFKKATNGYRDEYGNKDAYKQAYRQGFLRGYDIGFRQYSNNGRVSRRNDDPYYGRNDGGYGRDDGYGGYGRNDIYRVAQDQGYRDGLDHGASHGRDGKRFDPEGTRQYRNADQGYRSEYGNKEEYKQVYRESFRRGYEATNRL